MENFNGKKPNLDFLQFSSAHALYPGRKRFVTTEFSNFKKHKDWKIVLPLLSGYIDNYILWRKYQFGLGEFVPEAKNFCRYIDGRWWEEQYEIPVVKAKEKIPYF